MSIDYNSPLHIQWNVDEEGNFTTEEILNEQIVISENKAYLKQIPEKYYRVNVAGMVEIDIDEVIKVENKFKCDYKTGALYFHPSKEGQTITVEKYNGRGVIMYPASRIYSKTENGVVTETLESLVDNSNNKIQEFSDAESQRQSAESIRDSNENTRISQESTRVIAESSRATAENEREIAEASRASTETNRAATESQRVSAESSRVTAENTRATAESSRTTAENNRVTTENSRISAETNRSNAETTRTSAESSRASSETTRKTNESTRAAQETARVNAELLREQHMKVTPKENVSTYTNIATTYPTPQVGWLVNTIDTNKWWRYDGNAWVNVATYSSDALNSLIANLEPQYAIPKTTQQSITSFDSDTKEAKVLYEIEGQNAYNTLKNGNFTNGTTGWSGVYGTISVQNETLSLTGNGGHLAVRLSQIIDTKIKTGQKYFIRSKQKVTNSECTNIALENKTTSTTIETISNPSTNTDYELYGIFTADADYDNINVYVIHYYPDSATANGKVMEVMGGENGVMCIDMGTDASHPLYNKTADEMNAMFPTYFEGIGHSTVDLQTESKNLFDGELQSGGYSSTTGIKYVDTDRVRSKNYIKIKPDTNYIISLDGTATFCALYFFDINKNFISFLSNSSTYFTTPSNVQYMTFSKGIFTDLSASFQLEQGTTSTPYQPYKSKTLQPNITLRSVPAISDKLRNAVLVDGKLKALECAEHVKNVSDETVLNGSENWVYSADLGTVYRLGLGSSEYGTNIKGGSSRLIIDGEEVVMNLGYDLNFEHHYISGATKSLYLFILKSKVDIQTGSTTIEKFKTYLSQHPVTLSFQLENPLITKLPNLHELWSYTNGRLIDNSTIKPKITYTTAQNDVAQTQGTTEALQKHEDHLETIDNEIGILSNLNTTEKSSMVGAVNENTGRIDDLEVEVKTPKYSEEIYNTSNIFSTGVGTNESGNPLDYSGSVSGQVKEGVFKGLTLDNKFGDGDFENGFGVLP